MAIRGNMISVRLQRRWRLRRLLNPYAQSVSSTSHRLIFNQVSPSDMAHPFPHLSPSTTSSAPFGQYANSSKNLLPCDLGRNGFRPAPSIWPLRMIVIQKLPCYTTFVIKKIMINIPSRVVLLRHRLQQLSKSRRRISHNGSQVLQRI